MPLGISGRIERRISKLLSFIDAFGDATRDPGGFGGFEDSAIGDGTEHPEELMTCFFVGVAAADFVDIDSGGAETDGFGGHGGGFADEECCGSLYIVHPFDRNMYTIGFKIGGKFRFG